jgi:DNA-binding response OmpR family regulator
MRVLLVASNDDQAQTMRGLLTSSESHAFDVVYASSGWEAQQFSADGAYAALILDCTLADVENETLPGRLRATGVVAPALLLTHGQDQSAPGGSDARGDDRLPRTEALTGSTLARAIVAMGSDIG